MRVIGLDYGLKRIGVAVSDEGGRLAQPLKVLSAGSPKHVMGELRRIVEEYAPSLAVVGDPRMPDGGNGTLSGKVREFAGDLEREFGLKVVLRDERYTSFEAGERLKDAGDGNWRSRKKKLDRVSAAIILQDFLDEHPGGNS